MKKQNAQKIAKLMFYVTAVTKEIALSKGRAAQRVWFTGLMLVAKVKVYIGCTEGSFKKRFF